MSGKAHENFLHGNKSAKERLEQRGVVYGSDGSHGVDNMDQALDSSLCWYRHKGDESGLSLIYPAKVSYCANNPEPYQQLQYLLDPIYQKTLAELERVTQTHMGSLAAKAHCLFALEIANTNLVDAQAHLNQAFYHDQRASFETLAIIARNMPKRRPLILRLSDVDTQKAVSCEEYQEKGERFFLDLASMQNLVVELMQWDKVQEDLRIINAVPDEAMNKIRELFVCLPATDLRMRTEEVNRRINRDINQLGLTKEQSSALKRLSCNYGENQYGFAEADVTSNEDSPTLMLSKEKKQTLAQQMQQLFSFPPPSSIQILEIEKPIASEKQK